MADGSDGRLMHATSADGATWSPFTPVGNRATGSPAIVAFNNKLYCIYGINYPDQYAAAPDGELWMATFDGTQWSASSLPGNRSTAPGAGVGLAVKAGKMYCAARGPEGDKGLYWATFDGTTWSAFTQIPGAWSADTPNLTNWETAAPHDANRLYLTYRGPGTK
ncbi:hypothetical protein ACFY7Y_37945 [Streptomyces virginiae]|uniref:hypothetical protein n=1 Tax=Streptomyces virginiae TaxID=1961 RepID=UPI0036B7FF6B